MSLLTFPDVAQSFPSKRDAGQRATDFLEIARPYLTARAEEQASRCSQCGVPFCQVHCPLHNNIPDWLRLTAEGRLEEAYQASAATSTMPEICGRICPQDRLCEGNCVIEPGFGSVTIGSIEKFITDHAWDMGWVAPLRVRAERGQSVGIVGAGPAGLTAAELLRSKGYAVDVYDRHDRAGGLLTYGIPGFKLEKPVVARRVERLATAGVTFHQAVEVGRDVTLAELRDRHDAVLLATGVYGARDMAVAGANAGGVVAALDFLIAANRRDFGERVETPTAAAKDVIVVGGGDTAMDCVRTAVRQGARSVRCLYRRDRANMPGSMREVAHAEEEGVEFVWLSAPAALVGDPVVAVDVQRMRLGTADSGGRRAPVADGAAPERLRCDLVVKALGFDAEDLRTMLAAPDLATTRWGTLRVDHKNMMTSLDGVFAAGDIVRGASLVVWAIRDGRDVAAAVHGYLAARVGATRAAA